MIGFLNRAFLRHYKNTYRTHSKLSTIQQESTPQYIGEYGKKSQMSGHSEDNLYEKYRDFYNIAIEKVCVPGTTIVKNKD